MSTLTKSTSKYLDESEYLPYAPEVPSTVHRHHCKTGHGNDKLYITREDDGKILAYCHHCGKRGSHRKLGSRSLAAAKTASELRSVDGSAAHSDGSTVGLVRNDDKEGTDSGTGGPHTTPGSYQAYLDRTYSTSEVLFPSEWPDYAKKWWLEVGLTYDTALQERVHWHRDLQGLVLSPVRLGLTPAGTQYVQLKEFDMERKYRNFGDKVAGVPHVRTPLAKNLFWMVIVEDWRSCLRIQQDMRLSSPAWLPICAFGTSLTTGQLNSILKSARDLIPAGILIWLDNDSTVVKKAANTMAAQLRAGLSGMRVKVHTLDLEPKDFNCYQLKGELHGIAAT